MSRVVSVTFTVSVENTSAEDVDVTAIDDSVFGDVLDGLNPLITGTTCSAVTVVPGAANAYSCTFSADLVESAVDSPHVNTVDVTVEDDEGNSVSADDTASVTINDVVPSIVVTKTPSVSDIDEPGGSVTFTVSVENTSAEDVDVTAIDDSVFGDVLDGLNPLITGTTCSAVTVVPGAANAYSCTFSADLVESAIDSPHVNTVDVTVEDDEGNSVSADDTASVTINDVVPSIVVTKTPSVSDIDEPGGSVTFTVSVENTSAEDVDVTAIDDSVFGDVLDGLNPLITGTTCSAVTVVPGAANAYSCTFSADLVESAIDSPHVNTVDVTVEDDEGNSVSADDTASVTINDVVPSIVVTKTPSVSDIDEPGGSVTFTVSVENTSAEDVDVTAIDDSVFGDVLDGLNPLITGTTCSAVTVVPGAANAYSCTFSADLVESAIDSPHVNTVDVTVEDDEGNSVSADDTASVTINDVVPSIVVTKTPSVSDIDEPGGSVTFTVSVENTSAEDVDVTAIDDSVFGDVLDGLNPLITGTTCSAVTVVPGAANAYSCTFSADLVESAVDSPHVNTVDVTVEDDEGNSVSADDTASITINDVVPSIVVTKTPSVSDIDEPGGSVTFTVSVENTSAEDVDVTAIDDSVFGDVLDGLNPLITGTTCSAVTVVPGAANAYSCTFSADLVESAIDSPHVNTVDVTVEDDEGNSVSADDTASITINNVVPTLTVTKTARRPVPSMSPAER